MTLDGARLVKLHSSVSVASWMPNNKNNNNDNINDDGYLLVLFLQRAHGPII